MEKRKSGKDLRKEYNNLLDKTKALESRIKDRAEQLMTQYPNVLIGEITTAKDFLENWDITLTDTIGCIKIIEKIEDHIIKQHPYQQKKMFDK